MSNRTSAALITGLLFLLSLYFLVPLLRVDSSTWPAAEGRVIDRVARSHRNQHRKYDLFVTYEYEVNGQRHTGNRRSLAIAPVERVAAISSPQALEKAGFPVGQKVRVFYNPKNPTESVLEPRIGTGSRLMYGAVIGFTGLGFVGTLFGKVRRVR